MTPAGQAFTSGHAPPAADTCTIEERLLGALIAALPRFGVGTRVGLLGPEGFPQHRGGIGILACCGPGVRPGVAELLEQMGCAWTAEHDLGIEAHRRTCAASCAWCRLT